MAYKDFIETINEYLLGVADSLSNPENVPRNIFEFNEDLENASLQESTNAYKSSSVCSERSVNKEQLDSSSAIKRAILSRQKGRLDFLIEENNFLRAIETRLEMKNEQLGSTAGTF